MFSRHTPCRCFSTQSSFFPDGCRQRKAPRSAFPPAHGLRKPPQSAAILPSAWCFSPVRRGAPIPAPSAENSAACVPLRQSAPRALPSFPETWNSSPDRNTACPAPAPVCGLPHGQGNICHASPSRAPWNISPNAFPANPPYHYQYGLSAHLESANPQVQSVPPPMPRAFSVRPKAFPPSARNQKCQAW